MTLTDYTHKVHDTLESFHFFEIVDEFEPTQVAQSMSGTIIDFYLRRISYRMCAIVIYSLTMNYQILPKARGAVKH